MSGNLDQRQGLEGLTFPDPQVGVPIQIIRQQKGALSHRKVDIQEQGIGTLFPLQLCKHIDLSSWPFWEGRI